MEQAICKRVATVKFWDGYARWYKLWMKDTAQLMMCWWKRDGWK